VSPDAPPGALSDSNRPRGILFLTSCLYPCYTGGIELFHYYFIREISRNYPCYVLSQCARGLDEKNVRVFDISGPFGRGQTLFTVWHHLKLLLRLRRKIGLIHIPYSSKALFQFYHVMLLARLLRIPYVLRIHGGGMHPGRPDFAHAAYFRHAAGIIAVSEPVREEYQRRYSQPIQLMPSYLPFLDSPDSRDTLRERYDVTRDALVVLFLGSVKQIKGPDILLDALQQLGSDWLQQQRVLVLYAGGGDLLDVLRQRVRKDGIQSLVRLEGNVPYENVHHYYRMADLFVIPSLMEARPLALAEALYNGLPAIGTDIPTIANTIEHGRNGLVFKMGDAGELASAIRRLVEDKPFMAACVQECMKRRDSFNHFDDMVNDYSVLYRCLMTEARAGG